MLVEWICLGKPTDSLLGLSVNPVKNSQGLPDERVDLLTEIMFSWNRLKAYTRDVQTFLEVPVILSMECSQLVKILHMGIM